MSNIDATPEKFSSSSALVRARGIKQRATARACAPACANRCLRAASRVARRERDAAGRRLRPDEATTLEPLGQEHQALAIEPQHLQDVAALAAEDEDVAAERIGRKRRLHHRGQTIETLSHVGVAGHEPHARVRGETDHAMAPSRRSTQRTLASSTAPRSRTRVTPTSISITPLEGRGAIALLVLAAGSICTVTGKRVGDAASSAAGAGAS